MSIVVNDNFDVQAGKHIDRSYHKPGTTTTYASVGEANALNPVSLRYIGKTVLLVGGSEYWWKEGLADGNLIQKMTVAGDVGDEVYDYIDAGDEASRAYADTLVTKIYRYQGIYNPSLTSALPTAADITNPPAGPAIKSGYSWDIGGLGVGVSVTVGGITLADGDSLRAIVDTPGQTTANWAAQERNLDYAPENPVNRNAANGYVGLSAFRIMARNLLDTFTSFIQNAATAPRTWILQDKDGTLADLTDVTAVSPIGVQDMNIPGGALRPRLTGGCLPPQQFEMATSLINIEGPVFPPGVDSYAQFMVRMPRTWNRGQIKATVQWTARNGTAGVGTVTFEIKAGAYGNGDALQTVLGTAQTVSDTFIILDSLHTAPESAFITVANSPASGDLMVVQLGRLDNPTTFNQPVIVTGLSLGIITDTARV